MWPVCQDGGGGQCESHGWELFKHQKQRRDEQNINININIKEKDGTGGDQMPVGSWGR
jgi:hypothetical protein